MAEKILLVESSDAEFKRWTDPYFGIAAHLAIAGGGLLGGVEIERLTSAADLLEVAREVKTAKHLPARALVFKNTWRTDLGDNPMISSGRYLDKPADYDRETDPVFAWRGDDGRPLDPYGRFIASRLVKRAVPDVSYEAADLLEGAEGKDPEAEAIKSNPDLFRWEFGGPMGSELFTPKYGGFLARVNTTLALAQEPFMSIVDMTDVTMRSRGFSQPNYSDMSRSSTSYNWEPVEGADIATYHWEHPSTEAAMAKVADLLMGNYPGAVAGMETPIIPRKDPSHD